MQQEGCVGHVAAACYPFAFVSAGMETGEGHTVGMERTDSGMTAVGS